MYEYVCVWMYMGYFLCFEQVFTRNSYWLIVLFAPVV